MLHIITMGNPVHRMQSSPSCGLQTGSSPTAAGCRSHQDPWSGNTSSSDQDAWRHPDTRTQATRRRHLQHDVTPPWTHPGHDEDFFLFFQLIRVERDEYRRPKTYAVRVQFSLFLICWVEREKLLFLLFKSGFDDAMNMENDNINNSL